MNENDMVATIGEREFTFSPIRLGTLRKSNLLSDFKMSFAMEKGGLPNEEQLTAILRILHASAEKADVTMTWPVFEALMDDIDPIIGMTQILMAYQKVMMHSGFIKKGGATDNAGEAEGSQISTLPVSTDSSLPAQDGPMESSTT